MMKKFDRSKVSKVNKVKEFADEEKMELNLKKCKEMIIDFRRKKLSFRQ